MAISKQKKKFFDVEIPIINKTTHLLAFDISELNGKFIKYDLTRILRGKSMLMQLKVKVENEKATAIPREINLMPYFLRRMVRKGTDYIEDSFSGNCKDSQIKIKPILISRRKISRAVQNALRKKAREELTKYLKNKETEQIFEDVLKNKLQKELSLKLKKIYPLSLCEIRILKVEKDLEKEEKKNSKKEEKEVSKEEKDISTE